jgi:putative transposase
VEAVLEAQNEKLERRYRLEAEGFDIEKALKRAAEISGLTIEQIRAAGKESRRVQARNLTCYWAVRELHMTTVAVSKVLGICPTAVTKAVSPRRTVRQEPGDSLGRVSYKFTPVPYVAL